MARNNRELPHRMKKTVMGDPSSTALKMSGEPIKGPARLVYATEDGKGTETVIVPREAIAAARGARVIFKNNENKGKKVVRELKKIGKKGVETGTKTARELKRNARGIVEASKKVPGTIGRGAVATAKDIKENVEFVTPTKDELKEAFSETAGELKKVGKRGIEVGKKTIEMMAEGHQRSTNPEHGQPLDERPLPETPQDELGGGIKKYWKKFLEVTKGGVNMMARGHNMSTNPEYGQPLDERPLPETPRVAETGQGIGKSLKKALGVAKGGIGIMAEGQARSMNPERGQSFTDAKEVVKPGEESLYQPLDKETTLDPEWITPEEQEAQTNLDKARIDYAVAYNAFLKDRKAKAGGATKAWRLVMGSKVPESEIPPTLKSLEENYDKMAIAYGQQMYAKKLEDLMSSGKSPEEQETELKRYKQNEIFTRVVIQEQSALNALKAENLPPKERNIANKTLDWYLKQPRWKKMAISTTLATGVFALTVGSSGALGAGVVGVYAGKRLVRAVASSTMAQGAAKAYDWLFKDKSGAEKIKSEQELSKIFEEETLDASLAKSKKEYAEIVERERKAKRNRLITKAMVGIAAGGLTALELGHLAHGAAASVAHNSVEAQQATTPINPEDFNILKHTEHVTAPPSYMLDQHNVVSTPDIVGAGEHLENIPHSLAHTADFTLEKGPGALEHAYEKLVLDHTLPGKLPEGIVLDQTAATRALNEAANLVKLTEGHDVAGIQATELTNVVKLDDGVLHIIDPAKFNDIMDRLHHHSQELLDKGVFHDSQSATGYIKNVDWHEKIVAADMHGTDTAPGILGHPEVTPNQIEDFSHIPSAHEAGIDAARTQLLEKMGDKFKIDPSAINTPVGNPAMTLSDPIPGAKLPPDYVLNNPFNLSPEVFSKATQIYEQNIQHVFLSDTSLWDNIKHDPAENILSATANSPEKLNSFTSFVQKLHEVTGLDPKSETLISAAETNEEFAKRALQKAAEIGQLDKFV